MQHYITLPNQRHVSLGSYVAAWKAIKANPGALYPGFDHFPTRGHEILAKMRAGLHDRINRHLPPVSVRALDAEGELLRLAAYLRTPRLIIRRQSLGIHARRVADARFPQRLTTSND